jgi:hypothetical protein
MLDDASPGRLLTSLVHQIKTAPEGAVRNIQSGLTPPRTAAAMAPTAAMAPAATPAATPVTAMPNFDGVALHLALYGCYTGCGRCGLSGEAEKCTESERNRKHKCFHV